MMALVNVFSAKAMAIKRESEVMVQLQEASMVAAKQATESTLQYACHELRNPLHVLCSVLVPEEDDEEGDGDADGVDDGDGDGGEAGGEGEEVEVQELGKEFSFFFRIE